MNHMTPCCYSNHTRTRTTSEQAARVVADVELLRCFFSSLVRAPLSSSSPLAQASRAPRSLARPLCRLVSCLSHEAPSLSDLRLPWPAGRCSRRHSWRLGAAARCGRRAACRLPSSRHDGRRCCSCWCASVGPARHGTRRWWRSCTSCRTAVWLRCPTAAAATDDLRAAAGSRGGRLRSSAIARLGSRHGASASASVRWPPSRSSWRRLRTTASSRGAAAACGTSGRRAASAAAAAAASGEHVCIAVAASRSAQAPHVRRARQPAWRQHGRPDASGAAVRLLAIVAGSWRAGRQPSVRARPRSRGLREPGAVVLAVCAAALCGSRRCSRCTKVRLQHASHRAQESAATHAAIRATVSRRSAAMSSWPRPSMSCPSARSCSASQAYRLAPSSTRWLTPRWRYDDDDDDCNPTRHAAMCALSRSHSYPHSLCHSEDSDRELWRERYHSVPPMPRLHQSLHHLHRVGPKVAVQLVRLR